MRFRFPNLPDLGRVVVALKNVRWRDPLVQVWGLIGVVLVTGMVAYYVRRTRAGEQKNLAWESALLTKAAENAGWRPEVCFAEPGGRLADSGAGTEEMNLRACADAAAKRKDWRFLTAELRGKIAQIKTPVRRVLVTWSGTRGGDAKALDLYFDSVRDEAGGAPGEFVIGNGKRSKDGAIETTKRWMPGNAEGGELAELRICLVGDATAVTPAQKEALGELISSIEARSGTVELVIHEPGAKELLAHVP
jgi:hypothetical protein